MTREQILAVAKPILFNTEMVQALLDNRKHVTRRVVKPPYYVDDEEACRVSGLAMHRGIRATHGMPYPDAPYHPGDLLYVQETWGIVNSFPYEQGYDIAFKAGSQILYCTFTPERYAKFAKFSGKRGWQSPYFMPKEAARIFLRVTDVRVERLQDISRDDTAKEGAPCCLRLYGDYCGNGGLCDCDDYKKEFVSLWNSTIPKKDLALYGWNANPWVWAIEFERVVAK